MAASTIKVSKSQGKGHSAIVDYKFELLTTDAYAALLQTYTPFAYSDEDARLKYKGHRLTLATPLMMKVSKKTLDEVWDVEELIFIPYDIEMLKPNMTPPKIPRPITVKVKERRMAKTQDVVSQAVTALKQDPTFIIKTARDDPDFLVSLMNGLDAMIAEKEAEEIAQAQKEVAPEAELTEETLTDVLNDLGLTNEKVSIDELQRLIQKKQQMVNTK